MHSSLAAVGEIVHRSRSRVVVSVTKTHRPNMRRRGFKSRLLFLLCVAVLMCEGVVRGQTVGFLFLCMVLLG